MVTRLTSIEPDRYEFDYICSWGHEPKVFLDLQKLIASPERIYPFVETLPFLDEDFSTWEDMFCYFYFNCFASTSSAQILLLRLTCYFGLLWMSFVVIGQFTWSWKGWSLKHGCIKNLVMIVLRVHYDFWRLHICVSSISFPSFLRFKIRKEADMK